MKSLLEELRSPLLGDLQKFDTTPWVSTIASLSPGMRPMRKNKAMPKTPGADQIAEMASRGEDISGYFTNKSR
jgi:hypothetical protein